jgi:hypothetical protein
MMNHEKIIDYVIKTEYLDTTKGVECLSLKNVAILVKLSEIIGKRKVYFAINDEASVRYMDKIFEEILDNELFFDYEDFNNWLKSEK